MADWKDFFIATAGAAATLTGLIFVGVSISLAKILSIATLPGRALISLVLLMSILVVSILYLIPAETGNELGWEITVLGIVVWIFVSVIDVDIFQKKDKQYQVSYIVNILLNQISALPYLIGGIAVVRHGERGLSWVAPGIVFSFIKSVLDAWVLLIEINR